MSKVLEATCAAGVVESEGVPVPVAEILSEGLGPSEGFLVLDEDKAFYVAKTSADLDATIEECINGLSLVCAALNQIGLALTAIGANMTGPTTATPPGLPLNLAAIAAASTQITTAFGNLVTLKAILK